MGRRPLRGDNAGNTAVIESILVAFTVIAAVGFVASEAEPPTTKSNARQALLGGGADALAVLSELPANDSAAHDSLLEELVKDAMEDDCEGFEQKLAGYYPPGVVWQLHLEIPEGEPYEMCTTGEPTGERVTTFTAVQPTWSKLFVVPNVTQHNGVTEFDLFGNVVDADPLGMHGVLIRNCYADDTTEVALTFENGYQSTFNTYNGIRYTSDKNPEYMSSLSGYNAGYAVPYDTDSTYLAYTTSAADATQPVAQYNVEHNLAIDEEEIVQYKVHPKYTLSGTLSSTIQSVSHGDRFQPTEQDRKAGQNVTFEWSYGDVTSTLSQLAVSNATITVYNPAGAVHDTIDAGGVAGNKTMELTKQMLWGTYVAHLQLEFKELNGLGSPTGTIYIVNQVTHFNMDPPWWADKTEHIPPVYRLTLTAGFEDWV